MLRDKALKFRKATQFLVKKAEVTDSEALEFASVYPLWTPNTAYGGDNPIYCRRVINNEDCIYKVVQPHTAIVSWEPEVTPALWERLDVIHTGENDDPIIAAVGMRYELNKIYSDEGVLYRCVRDDLGTGTLLYYMPHELVGDYFQLV